MIIQCPKCETKFRVPDAKVASAGVKVRCSKCAHLFVVRKDLHNEIPSPKPPIPTSPTLGSGPPAVMGPGPDSPGPSGLDAPAAAPLEAFSPPEEEGPAPSGIQDPFDWSGADFSSGEPPLQPPGQTDVDPFLGPGAPRFGSGVEPPPFPSGPPPPPSGPPPLPPRGPSAPFSEGLAPSEDADDESSLRFPPPPALTNDLEPEPEGDWAEIEPPPREAVGDDPFQVLDEASLPPSPSVESTPVPPVGELPSTSQGIPIMQGRAEGTPVRRTVDIPVVSSGPGPRPPAPVSSLRWPPWLGVALGLAVAFYALPELLGDKPRPAADGSAELETVALRVYPFAHELPPSLWVVSGTAETKSRPYPNGVLVEVRLRGPGGPILAQAVLGQDVPESVLAAGPEAVARFMRHMPAPSLGPASRQRFVSIVDVEPQPGDIDVRYEALPAPEPPIAVDGSDAPR